MKNFKQKCFNPKRICCPECGYEELSKLKRL